MLLANRASQIPKKPSGTTPETSRQTSGQTTCAEPHPFKPPAPVSSLKRNVMVPPTMARGPIQSKESNLSRSGMRLGSTSRAKNSMTSDRSSMGRLM